MQELFGNPLTLAILALLIIQSGSALLGGLSDWRQSRRSNLSSKQRAQIRQALLAWGVIDGAQTAKTPAARSLLRSWLGITAWGRLGQGAGVLLASGAMVIVLALLLPLGPLMPPVVLIVALLLHGYSLGMSLGNALGLLIGAPRVGLAADQPAAPEPPTRRRLYDYAQRQVALLPGALLLIDWALVGGLNLLFLKQWTPTELWTLAIFPGLMLLIWALDEVCLRRLVNLPLRLPRDPALAECADAALRARMIGTILEFEVFSLFILVMSQWLAQVFSLAHPGGVIYNGALLAYAVVLLSLRGLLERAQRQTGSQRADQSKRIPQSAPGAEA